MSGDTIISRRRVIGSLASSCALNAIGRSAQAAAFDDKLIRLGQELLYVTSQIDRAIQQRTDLSLRLLDRLSGLEAEIIATPANSGAGLLVKARAACWALLGDLDPVAGSTMDRSMSLSIVRDLIRLHNPSLERPGALNALAEAQPIQHDASMPTPCTGSNGEPPSLCCQ